MPIKILLVDDHIPITDFLKQTLKRLDQPVEVEISNSIETAYHTIFFLIGFKIFVCKQNNGRFDTNSLTLNQ